MLLSGFKDNQGLFLDTHGRCRKRGFGKIMSMRGIRIGRYFVNSVIVTVSSVILTLISSCAAFALARFEFRGQNILLILIIGGLMLFLR